MARALRITAHAARILLGLIFVAAGVLKSLDVAEFARQTAEYHLVGPGVAALLAPLLIAFETTLGIALLLGWRPRLAATLTGGLLVFFIGLEAWGLSHGRTEACGCFGAYVKRTPQQVILEDLGFLALAVLVFAGIGEWQAARRRLTAVLTAATAGVMLAFAVASPRLPLDPFVTSLKTGRTATDLGIASRLPEEGPQGTLVAILDVTDPVSKQAAASLNTLKEQPAPVAVVALTPSSEQEQAAFLWEAYPAFDVIPMDRGLLKPLYRRLPIYFLLRGGRVERIFPGPRPPEADLLSSKAS
ncbi:MAG TPA: MauE/DoxX family redox-associated membrane protein [Candidatus Polarisedimenticolia bacterium]|nr:MauE/DoxX family redox-associated membrane protein [Candidatus Polarisedimenticolia bacterium]